MQKELVCRACKYFGMFHRIYITSMAESPALAYLVSRSGINFGRVDFYACPACGTIVLHPDVLAAIDMR